RSAAAQSNQRADRRSRPARAPGRSRRRLPSGARPVALGLGAARERALRGAPLRAPLRAARPGAPDLIGDPDLPREARGVVAEPAVGRGAVAGRAAEAGVRPLLEGRLRVAPGRARRRSRAEGAPRERDRRRDPSVQVDGAEHRLEAVGEDRVLVGAARAALGAPGRSGSRPWCASAAPSAARSDEHTSELQSLTNLVCRLLLEKKTHDTTMYSHSSE